MKKAVISCFLLFCAGCASQRSVTFLAKDLAISKEAHNMNAISQWQLSKELLSSAKSLFQGLRNLHSRVFTLEVVFEQMQKDLKELKQKLEELQNKKKSKKQKRKSGSIKLYFRDPNSAG